MLVRRLEALLEMLARDDAPTTVHDRHQAIDTHIADSLSGLAVDAVHSARRIADLGPDRQLVALFAQQPAHLSWDRREHLGRLPASGV